MTSLRDLCQAAAALDKDSDDFDFALWDIQQTFGVDFNGAEALEAFLAAITEAEERGRRDGRDGLVGTLAMFAVGASARHTMERTSYSEGWSDAANAALDAAETYPVPL